MIEVLQYFIFILIFAIIGVTCYYSKVKSLVFLNISFIILLLILACRDKSVGADTANYLDIYNNIGSMSWAETFNYGKSMEIGYVVLCKLSNLIGLTYQNFLLLVGIIMLIGPYMLIKTYSKDFYLSVFVFITLFFFACANTTRKNIGLSIICIFYILMIKRKYLWALILIPIMYLFHKTCIVALAFYIGYFLLRKQNARILLGFTIAIGAVVCIGIEQIVEVVVKILPKYEYYTDEKYYLLSINNVFMTLLYLTFACYFIVVNKNLFYNKTRRYKNNYFAIKNQNTILRNRKFCKANNEINLNEVINLEKYHINQNRMFRANGAINEIKRTVENNLIIDNRVIVEKDSKFDHKIAFLCLLFAIIFSILSIRFTLLDRIVGYFAIILVVFIPNIFNNNSKYFKILSYVLLISYCLSVVVLRPEWTIFPYLTA